MVDINIQTVQLSLGLFALYLTCSSDFYHNWKNALYSLLVGTACMCALM